MPFDPQWDKISRGLPRDQQIAARLGDIERRLTVLEKSSPAVQITTNTPTGSARNGTLAGDQGNTRLWLRLNGAWHYTVLT